MSLSSLAARRGVMMTRCTAPRRMTASRSNSRRTSRQLSTQKPMTPEERNQKIRDANNAMQGYVETRILAKQGLLKSKRKQSSQNRSENAIQFSLFLSLAVAFVASPFIGKKIAQDKEFRDKYVPEWYDFTVKAPSSAWTRKDLHDQIITAEKELRERAIAGDFSPEKLQEMKQNLAPRSDLTEEDHAMAAKYGWGRLHPGLDPDDDDEDED